MSTHSKVIARTERERDTHTQTHRHDENITSTAYAGGKNEQKMYCVCSIVSPGGRMINVPTSRAEGRGLIPEGLRCWTCLGKPETRLTEPRCKMVPVNVGRT